MHERTAQEVFDNLTATGEYRPVDIDYDLIRKMSSTSREDRDYVSYLLKQKIVNWRIIYLLFYDILRQLCESLARMHGVKVSNHQGCFAYVCVNYSKLELDWSFFEQIRTTRNRNKYEGSKILKKNFKDIEVQLKLYIETIQKVVEEHLKEKFPEE